MIVNCKNYFHNSADFIDDSSILISGYIDGRFVRAALPSHLIEATDAGCMFPKMLTARPINLNGGEANSSLANV